MIQQDSGEQKIKGRFVNDRTPKNSSESYAEEINELRDALKTQLNEVFFKQIKEGCKIMIDTLSYSLFQFRGYEASDYGSQQEIGL